MNKLGDVAQTVYSYSQSRSKRPSIAIERLSREDEDKILDHYPQLVTDQYRSWFVIKLRSLGKSEFIRLADRSIKYGRNPQKLFSHLCK